MTREAAPRQSATLREQVRELDWYHTMELAPGVVTPGWFDLRPVAAQVPLPASLRRLRCLDVGTFDGFWAFEMERRGAAEVVAVDVLDPRQWDWPVGSDARTVEQIGRRKGHGEGFVLARQALESGVNRIECSVYDLDVAELGDFDVIHLGSLLLHLRDPIRALERLRPMCTGSLVVLDAVDWELGLLLRRRPAAVLDGVGRPWWWRPNRAGLARMVEAAGFEVTAAPRMVWMPAGPGQPRPALALRGLLGRAGREAALARLRGDPHASLVARPRG